jgi:hypothetical protein
MLLQMRSVDQHLLYYNTYYIYVLSSITSLIMVFKLQYVKFMSIQETFP